MTHVERAAKPCFYQKGFTVIEVMVTAAIVVTLTSIAVPAFQKTVEKYRVSTATDQLVAALALTRSAALQKNGFVRIQRLEGGDCPALSSSDRWHCGWYVYFDANDDGTLDAGQGEKTLQTFRISNRINVVRSDPGVGMTANRWGQLSGVNATSFTVSPMPDGISSKFTQTVCTNSGGRIRVVAGSDC